MGVFSKVTDPFVSLSSNLANKVAIMPERDKRALYVLMLFFVAMLFFGVYLFHKKANKVEASAMAMQQQLFWMRGQADNITTENTADRPALEGMIQQVAAQQNIKLNTVSNGNSVQFSAIHQNASVLGSFLSRLERDGVTFQRLTLNQQPNLEIKAEATASY